MAVAQQPMPRTNTTLDGVNGYLDAMVGYGGFDVSGMREVVSNGRRVVTVPPDVIGEWQNNEDAFSRITRTVDEDKLVVVRGEETRGSVVYTLPLGFESLSNYAVDQMQENSTVGEITREIPSDFGKTNLARLGFNHTTQQYSIFEIPESQEEI